jgi:hypothetical protein
MSLSAHRNRISLPRQVAPFSLCLHVAQDDCAVSRRAFPEKGRTTVHPQGTAPVTLVHARHKTLGRATRQRHRKTIGSPGQHKIAPVSCRPTKLETPEPARLPGRPSPRRVVALPKPSRSLRSQCSGHSHGADRTDELHRHGRACPRIDTCIHSARLKRHSVVDEDSGSPGGSWNGSTPRCVIGFCKNRVGTRHTPQTQATLPLCIVHWVHAACCRVSRPPNNLLTYGVVLLAVAQPAACLTNA